MKTKADRTDEASQVRPKYYEVDGALRANANRAWLLAFPDDPHRTGRNRLRRLRAHATADGDPHRPEWRRLGCGQARQRQ